MNSKKILGLWNADSKASFHKSLDPRQSKDLIKAAYRNGIKSFDTAFSYREADDYLASALKELGVERESVEIISKVMPLPSFRKKAETSLRRLKTSYFNILLIHWPTEDKSLFETLKELEKMKDEEKALAIGVSNFPFELLEKISRDFEIEYHERPLSLIWTRDYHREKALGLKTLSYSPMGMGLLSGKYSSKEETGDDRKNLQIDDGKLKTLLEKLETIGKNYGLTKAQMALSYVYSLEPYGVIHGFSDIDQMKILSSLKDLSVEDMLELEILSSEISKENHSDNIFSHNWHYS